MMRAKVDASQLDAALRGGVAQNKCILPVLSHALLESTEAGLRVTTDNLAIRVQTTIRAEIDTVGSLCANESMLRHALTGGGTVDLKEDGALIVKRKTGRNKVLTLPATDWPTPAIVDWTETGIDPIQFAAAISSVAYAALKTHVQPYCCAVNIATGDPGYAAATNASRTATASLVYDGTPFMIPIDAVSHLLKRLDGTAKVWLGRRKDDKKPVLIAIDRGNERIEAALLADHKFPDFLAIIPTDEPKGSATVNRAVLRGEIARLKPFCERSITTGGRAWLSNAARVIIAADGFRIQDSSGENFTVVDVKETSGEFDASFDLNFFADALDSSDSEFVTVDIHDYRKCGMMVVRDENCTNLIAGLIP